MARLVIAIGGNALLRRGELPSIEIQRRNLIIAARSIVAVADELSAEIVVTHGNGPQIGLLAIQAEMCSQEVPAAPLDVLGAQSQGQIGYLIAQALNGEFRRLGKDREVVVVLTRTVVEGGDPAFEHPTKPVGPVYDEPTARTHSAQRGWAIAPDGKHWRRVVASPRPLKLVESMSITALVQTGAIVVASGGGGIPVVEVGKDEYEGREAVIDKDLAAVVLARAVAADGLILLSDVPCVYRNWGTAEAEPISEMSLEEAREGLRTSQWANGSMEPKVGACLEFLESGGRFAAIGQLDHALPVARGLAGTRLGAPITYSRCRPTSPEYG